LPKHAVFEKKKKVASTASPLSNLSSGYPSKKIIR
ncbi:hypothetical protein WG66_006884, partial [Moniliophthora roreri]